MSENRHLVAALAARVAATFAEAQKVDDWVERSREKLRLAVEEQDDAHRAYCEATAALLEAAKTKPSTEVQA